MVMHLRSFLDRERGTAAKLAQELGVSPVMLSQWAALSKRPTPQNCVAIEQATSGAVSRRDLRPDDWGDIWPELIDNEHPWPACGISEKDAA